MDVVTAWLAGVAGARLPAPALDVAAALSVAASGGLITDPPTVEHLADICDRDRVAVRQAVSDLISAGWLTTLSRVTADGPTPLALTRPTEEIPCP